MCLYILICATKILGRICYYDVCPRKVCFTSWMGTFAGTKCCKFAMNLSFMCYSYWDARESVFESVGDKVSNSLYSCTSFSYLTSLLCTCRQRHVDVFATRWPLVSFNCPPFRAKRRKDVGESYVRRKTVVVSKESKEKNCPSSLLSELSLRKSRRGNSALLPNLLH